MRQASTWELTSRLATTVGLKFDQLFRHKEFWEQPPWPQLISHRCLY